MSGNQQLDGGVPDWAPAHIDYLTELAERDRVTIQEMAVAGSNALWDAASQHVPQLLTPARMLLERATADDAALYLDTPNYLGARLAKAFFAMHKDWANGKDLSSEAVEATHLQLTDVIKATLPIPRTRNSTVGYEVTRYLARATYMASLTRKGDPSCIIFPAPPDIQENGTDGGPPHSAFVATENYLIPCDVEPKVVEAQQSGGLISIHVNGTCAAAVYQNRPEIYRTLADLPHTVRKERAMRYVARLLLQEVDNIAKDREVAFLDICTAQNIAFLQDRVGPD